MTRWLALLFALWGCTRATAAEPVRIAAASSLAPVLGELTDTHDAIITFGPSQRLAHQLTLGMDVDLAILAHPRWIASIEAQDLIAEHVALAGNRLVVVGDQSLTEAKRVGIGAQGVPVGDYARTALKSWGLWSQIQNKTVTSPSAASLLANTLAGHVDAAIIYASDAAGSADLTVQMQVPTGTHEPIVYSLLYMENGSKRDSVRAVFDHLQSDTMLGAFARYGFSRPTKNPVRISRPEPSIDTLKPLLRSLWVAIAALALAFPPALGLAWLMARRKFPGKALLNTVCLTPLVLPPVVTGWLLLKGAHWSGIGIAFTPWAAVVAAAVVGFPLLLILTRGAIEAVDIRFEHQAQTLGFSATGAFWRVTLPMALPGIAAGAVLAFARALGEFGATAIFAGDQPGSTRTLALGVYAAAEIPGGEAAAMELVVVSIVVTMVALFIYERLVWRQRRRCEDWT